MAFFNLSFEARKESILLAAEASRNGYAFTILGHIGDVQDGFTVSTTSPQETQPASEPWTGKYPYHYSQSLTASANDPYPFGKDVKNLAYTMLCRTYGQAETDRLLEAK